MVLRVPFWYQGESNANRAHAYREVFPLMIQSWRDAWKQGDFPFYWVQLADFQSEMDEPMNENWPELREAQTLTLDKLKNVGEAVIIDVGEGRDIHPRNKQTVANRLLRHALVKDYEYDIPHQSPRYKDLQIKGSKVTVTFDHVGSGLYCFDTSGTCWIRNLRKRPKVCLGRCKINGERQSRSLVRQNQRTYRCTICMDE